MRQRAQATQAVPSDDGCTNASIRAWYGGTPLSVVEGTCGSENRTREARRRRVLCTPHYLGEAAAAVCRCAMRVIRLDLQHGLDGVAGSANVVSLLRTCRMSYGGLNFGMRFGKATCDCSHRSCTSQNYDNLRCRRRQTLFRYSAWACTGIPLSILTNNNLPGNDMHFCSLQYLDGACVTIYRRSKLDRLGSASSN